MLELTIPSMTCGHCVGTVTKAVQSVDPRAALTVDLSGKTVRIETTANRDAVAGALAEAGYPPQ